MENKPKKDTEEYVGNHFADAWPGNYFVSAVYDGHDCL